MSVTRRSDFTRKRSLKLEGGVASAWDVVIKGAVASEEDLKEDVASVGDVASEGGAA